MDPVCHLLRLSDCVLLKLLGWLDATSLYQLSRTSKYFQQLVQDKLLWRFIEARHEPNSDKKVNFVVDLIHNRSKIILLRAQSYKVGLVPHTLFTKIVNYDNIRILALENQLFDSDMITVKNFPRHMEELSLRSTHISKYMNFFRFSKNYMRELRVLILDDCQWVDAGCLMSISNYPKLEVLSVVKCRRFDSDSIAYFGLARMGYLKLKVLDCRFTVLARPVLGSFYRHQSLLAYYFQHERCCEPTPIGLNECRKMKFHCFNDLLDRILSSFLSLIGEDNGEVMPKSQLYVDPYGECECGYQDKDFEEEMEELQADFVCDVCHNAQVLVHEPALEGSAAPPKRTCSQFSTESNTSPGLPQLLLRELQQRPQGEQQQRPQGEQQQRPQGEPQGEPQQDDEPPTKRRRNDVRAYLDAGPSNSNDAPPANVHPQIFDDSDNEPQQGDNEPKEADVEPQLANDEPQQAMPPDNNEDEDEDENDNDNDKENKEEEGNANNPLRGVRGLIVPCNEDQGDAPGRNMYNFFRLRHYGNQGAAEMPLNG